MLLENGTSRLARHRAAAQKRSNTRRACTCTKETQRAQGDSVGHVSGVCRTFAVTREKLAMWMCVEVCGRAVFNLSSL